MKPKPSAAEIVRTLVEENVGGQLASLRNALIRTLSTDEVCILFWEFHSHERRTCDKLLGAFSESLNQGYRESHEKIIQNLLEELESINYRQRQRAGYCLYAMLPKVHPEQQELIYTIFGKSKDRMNRRRAYSFLGENWRHEFESLLMNKYKLFQDPECLEIIVAKSSQEFLIENSDIILNHVSGKHRRSFYRRTIGASSALREQCKNEDALTYAFLVSELGLHISADEALELLMRYLSDPRLGILIAAIGRMQLKSTLVEFYHNYGTKLTSSWDPDTSTFDEVPSIC
jgi:hypothetical protein